MRSFVFRFDSFEFRKFKRGPKLELGTVESNHEKFEKLKFGAADSPQV